MRKLITIAASGDIGTRRRYLIDAFKLSGFVPKACGPEIDIHAFLDRIVGESRLYHSKVKVVGSSLTECIHVLVGTFSCVKVDERKAQDCE